MIHQERITLPRLSGSREQVNDIIDRDVSVMEDAIVEVDASEMEASSISVWQQIFRRAFVVGNAESVVIVKPTPYAAQRLRAALPQQFADKVSVIERRVG